MLKIDGGEADTDNDVSFHSSCSVAKTYFYFDFVGDFFPSKIRSCSSSLILKFFFLNEGHICRRNFNVRGFLLLISYEAICVSDMSS